MDHCISGCDIAAIPDAGVLRVLRRQGRWVAVPLVFQGGVCARQRPADHYHVVGLSRCGQDFALIVPTPRVLDRKDIRTVESKTLAHLDAYTAPRLVEYFDHDPCPDELAELIVETPVIIEQANGLFRKKQKPIYRRADALGVKIKGEYAVGNYDILILKADHSDGLVTFLTGEGNRLPDGAAPVPGMYVMAGMKFFVAKVNLSRHSASEVKELPPLQISFRSRNFVLPIQLGKPNSCGTQNALFFMLSRKGRVETTNYNQHALPTDTQVPVFVEQLFGPFYKAAFNRAVGAYGGIVMEYAWDMQWCDPCAADPLSRAELQDLGVGWLKSGDTAAQDVYVTRLHAQYTGDQMPKDVMFRETRTRDNFQGRYVMNHRFKGDVSCKAGKDYVQRPRLQMRREAVDLAEITGWDARKIEQNIRKTIPAIYW
ncbi:MAG: hypothetical protein ACI8R4_000424 [Paracoccaceae bacterium]